MKSNLTRAEFFRSLGLALGATLTPQFLKGEETDAVSTFSLTPPQGTAPLGVPPTTAPITPAAPLEPVQPTAETTPVEAAPVVPAPEPRAAITTNPAPVAPVVAAPAPKEGDSLINLVADNKGSGGAPFLMRGPHETVKIALTFDDGPTPGVTEHVLDALERHNAKATFFMIGQRVKSSPALALRVKNAGHEIANHSYTHPALAGLSAARVTSELKQCQEVMSDTLGVRPNWFRPPYGSFKIAQTPLAREQKLNVVIWSVDPRDWSRPGVSAIQSRILNNTTGGDIVLCHDLHKQTAEAAEGMIKGLTSKGFELVTLSDLILGRA